MKRSASQPSPRMNAGAPTTSANLNRLIAWRGKVFTAPSSMGKLSMPRSFESAPQGLRQTIRLSGAALQMTSQWGVTKKLAPVGLRRPGLVDGFHLAGHVVHQ